MSYLLYLFGFLPSVIWLLFYLRKDVHPESNQMVVRVFFLGALAAFFAILPEKGLQIGFQKLADIFFISEIWQDVLTVFIAGAFIEEYLKYLVVKIAVYKNSELDEPFDLLLYMIISALGFASLENILVLSNLHPFLTAAKALETMAWRFISATFLHALCSAVIGYFMAYSLLFCPEKRKWLLGCGFVFSTGLHGLYNFSIMKIAGLEKFILPLIIIIALAIIVSCLIKKLKRLKSVCALKAK